jgi:hypothetical protein
MENKTLLSSLAMDLKRVALGLNRKSYTMADRFLQEAMKRKNELNRRSIAPYINRILDKLDLLSNIDRGQRAEDSLMYSILIQNYVLYK